MKQKKLILQMKYKWRTLRILRIILYGMIKVKLKYTSPCVRHISKKISDNFVDLIELQQKYEECTGCIIKYYKRYKE